MSNYFLIRIWASIVRFGTLRLATKAFAGIPSPTWSIRSLYGAQMHLDLSRSMAQKLLFLEGERFMDERALLQRLLRKGMTVVDVGANIGYYLLQFQKCVGSTGRVICIEPSIENLPELRRNIAANDYTNVVLHEVALGSSEGEIGLHSGVNSGVADKAGAAHIVAIRKLDTLVTERIDFLKIDVEGFEGQVLEGAEKLLATHKPILFLELHPHIVGRFGFSVRSILDGLSRHYGQITLYEKQPLDQQTLSDKIATRYLGRDPLKVVSDPATYVARFDRGDVSHTYWAVCTA